MNARGEPGSMQSNHGTIWKFYHGRSYVFYEKGRTMLLGRKFKCRGSGHFDIDPTRIRLCLIYTARIRVCRDDRFLDVGGPMTGLISFLVKEQLREGFRQYTLAALTMPTKSGIHDLLPDGLMKLLKGHTVLVASNFANHCQPIASLLRLLNL